MQVSFKFRFISTVTNRENDKQNDGNYIAYICKAIVNSLEVAEINRVHYLKHNRKTVRLTKTNFADYVFIFDTFFT